MRVASPLIHAPCSHSGSAHSRRPRTRREESCNDEKFFFALSPNGKHPVTLHPANELFSHPETHDPLATSSSPEPEQPSWTNLFQEPVPTQRASSER